MIEKVSKDMGISEILSKHPEAAGIMMAHGLRCIGCVASSMESLEMGAKSHGLSDKAVEEIVEEINAAISKKKVGEKV